jgi:hypothetical protein
MYAWLGNWVGVIIIAVGSMDTDPAVFASAKVGWVHQAAMTKAAPTAIARITRIEISISLLRPNPQTGRLSISLMVTLKDVVEVAVTAITKKRIRRFGSNTLRNSNLRRLRLIGHNQRMAARHLVTGHAPSGDSTRWL